jgi:hypothetical protein
VNIFVRVVLWVWAAMALLTVTTLVLAVVLPCAAQRHRSALRVSRGVSLLTRLARQKACF